MQDEHDQCASALADMPDPTAQPTAAQLREIDRCVRAALERERTAAAEKRRFSLADVFSWKLLTVLVCVISGLLVTALLLDEVNIYDIPICGSVADLDSADDAKPAGLSERLGAILPLFTIAIAFFVGATGLQRLALYDEQFSIARTERREDITELRKEIAENVRASRVALDADLTQVSDDVREVRLEVLSELKVFQSSISKLEGRVEVAAQNAERSLGLVEDENKKLREETALSARAAARQQLEETKAGLDVTFRKLI